MEIQSSGMLLSKMTKAQLINFVIEEAEEEKPSLKLIQQICKSLKRKL